MARSSFVSSEPVGDFSAPETNEDWLALATRVRSEQDAKPMAERIHIGGELVATTLLPGVVISERVMRFDDYADHWNAGAARLPAG